jgi:hypothetical protein
MREARGVSSADHALEIARPRISASAGILAGLDGVPASASRNGTHVRNDAEPVPPSGDTGSALGSSALSRGASQLS